MYQQFAIPLPQRNYCSGSHYGRQDCCQRCQCSIHRIFAYHSFFYQSWLIPLLLRTGRSLHFSNTMTPKWDTLAPIPLNENSFLGINLTYCTSRKYSNLPIFSVVVSILSVISVRIAINKRALEFQGRRKKFMLSKTVTTVTTFCGVCLD